jgi:hypothetical protein
VGVLQTTASDRTIVVETRVTGSTGTAWIEEVGATVNVAGAAGLRSLEIPPSCAPIPRYRFLPGPCARPTSG